MDFLKKYKTWEIIVALLPPFFVMDQGWHRFHDQYPSALYQVVSTVFDYVYCAILIYTFYCMYRGARQSNRFPKLMLSVLIAYVLFSIISRVTSYIPVEPYDFDETHYILRSALTVLPYIVFLILAFIVDIKLFKEGKHTVLAVALLSILALPVLSDIVYEIWFSFTDFSSVDDDFMITAQTIVYYVFSLLDAGALSIVFLHRNDFNKPDIVKDSFF